MAFRPSPDRPASATTAAPAAPLLTLEAAMLDTPHAVLSTGVAALTRSTNPAASCAVPAAPAHAAAPAVATAMYGAVSIAVDAMTGSTDARSAYNFASVCSCARFRRVAPIATTPDAHREARARPLAFSFVPQ